MMLDDRGGDAGDGQSVSCESKNLANGRGVQRSPARRTQGH